MMFRGVFDLVESLQSVRLRIWYEMNCHEYNGDQYEGLRLIKSDIEKIIDHAMQYDVNLKERENEIYKQYGRI